jgi:hypothetical protein
MRQQFAATVGLSTDCTVLASSESSNLSAVTLATCTEAAPLQQCRKETTVPPVAGGASIAVTEQAN